MISGLTLTARSQTIKVLAGNTLNGAMNGAILGGATMGLQNSTDFDPARIGLGLGTLYGIGVGVYDLARISPGEQFYISGTFNDGTNTSILVLLDTFYGAAGGAIIASSFTLIAKKPFVEGLQYGASAGAWAGFVFGIFDAFVLAKGPGAYQASSVDTNQTGGIIEYSNQSKKLNIGLLNPSLATFKEAGTHSLGTKTTINVKLLELKVRF